MLVSFTDALGRLLSFVHACPELRKEFDSPRYYPAESHPDLFDPGDKPREPDQERLAKKGRLFLRRFLARQLGVRPSPLFTAFGPDGGKLWIMRTMEGELVHCTGDGSRATRMVEDAEIFLDQAELDLFFGLAAPGRRAFLGWEAACLLAGERPEPLWKHVLRQTEPPASANRVGKYRSELAAAGFLPLQMLGKLEFYSWEAIRAWAQSRGIEVPPMAVQAEQEDSADFLRFHQVERILAERFGGDAVAIGYEMAGWVFYKELDAYTHVRELGDQCRFRFPETHEFRQGRDFNPERPYEYLPLLERCYFKKSDIARFVQLGPVHRYISGTALVERFERLRGSKDRAKALIVSGIEESILVAFHPIYGGPDVEEILPQEGLDYSLPPVDLCLYFLDGVLAMEANESGGIGVSVDSSAADAADIASADVQPAKSAEPCRANLDEAEKRPITQKARKVLWLWGAWQKIEDACQKAEEPIGIGDIPGTKEEFYALVKWLDPRLEGIKTYSTFDSEYLEPGGYRFPRKMKSGEHSWQKIFRDFS